MYKRKSDPWLPVLGMGMGQYEGTLRDETDEPLVVTIHI
jgi:hypothetical protein